MRACVLRTREGIVTATSDQTGVRVEDWHAGLRRDRWTMGR
jgi:hypothetical protein